MISETTGEYQLQEEMGTRDRAQRFYDKQMQSTLSPRMAALITKQEMAFIATSDAAGNCDCSPRFGQQGFIQVLNRSTLAYPEFRGNGVFASLGNILENPHIGIVFVDFFDSTVGLHVNGKAHSYTPDDVPEEILQHLDQEQSRIIDRWVVITIEEAYIHCSKHVPKLQKLDKKIDWGTDDPVAKATDYFNCS